MSDVHELSFKNVVDTILKPQGISVGGYPDSLFISLSEKERELWQCSICYLIARDAKQCDNKHNFCATCVFAWSMTYGANSDKCPVCRTKQHEYLTNTKLNADIASRWVKCPEPGCALRCTMADFLRHSHGLKLYNQVDLDEVPRRRPAPVNIPGPRVLLFPSLERSQAASEGRNLLQDMMLVLHLEMELRRRAIDRFAAEQNDTERARHMTEVLAIQEQMQELTGFLNLLFSLPPGREQLSERRQRFGGMNRFPAGAPNTGTNESSGDSDSSDSSEASGVVSRMRVASLAQRRESTQPATSSRITGNRNMTLNSTSTTTTINPIAPNPSATRGNSTTAATTNNQSTTAAPRQPSTSRTANATTETTSRPANPSTTTQRPENRPVSSRRINASLTPRRDADVTEIATRIAPGGAVPNSLIRERPPSSRESASTTLPPIIPSLRTGGNTALGNTALGNTASGNTASGNTALGNTASGNTASGNTASGITRREPDIPETREDIIESNNTALNMHAPAPPPTRRRPAPPAVRTLNTTRASVRRAASIDESRTGATSRNQTQINRTRGSSEPNTNVSNMPSSSGQLMRARRRSEIQRQIHEDLENLMTRENDSHN